MGSAAKAAIVKHGWQHAPFTTLLGASGGPKWLILSEFDQVLATDLLAYTSHPLTMLGSSIGTWRHACLSQPDPVGAINNTLTCDRNTAAPNRRHRRSARLQDKC